MTEQQIQTKRIKHYESLGYYVIKLIKTNKNGCPDLLAVKENDVIFEEVKTKKGILAPLQCYRMEELIKLGIKVNIHYGE